MKRNKRIKKHPNLIQRISDRLKPFSWSLIPNAYDLISRISPKTRKSLTASMALTFFAFSTYSYVLAPTGVLARRELLGIIREKENAIAKAEYENNQLKNEISGLQDDPDRIERIARNVLSMARENETIYRIEKNESQTYVLNMSR
ncbi:MAG: septum formation initiator family protein [Candidatus Lindowbacteria bacterium]|nr:septum formation initiator family protein [Candidatus Lindowbacteria bacterium]